MVFCKYERALTESASFPFFGAGICINTFQDSIVKAVKVIAMQNRSGQPILQFFISPNLLNLYLVFLSSIVQGTRFRRIHYFDLYDCRSTSVP